MIGSTFNEQLQIIEVTFKGKIDLDELIQFIFNIGQNKYLPPSSKLIIDATRSHYSFGIDALEAIAKKIEANTLHFERLKGAFIHQNTRDTAISIYIERNKKFTSYEHKTFCTREAAIEWLLVEVAC
ncbi:MAG: STAS/SEC14 domain-containing protein [Salinivirgaceae bacterium]|jgi:hypothetical protein|nr:STAS/SEC14 domain-containing protein [Salinivirgaceae bacterium]